MLRNILGLNTSICRGSKDQHYGKGKCSQRPYSRHLRQGCIFYGKFFEKMTYCLLVTHEQMPFLTIFHKNTLFKTQSTRLHLIVNPSKGLKCTMSFLRNNPKISKNILLDLLNEKLGSQNPYVRLPHDSNTKTTTN